MTLHPCPACGKSVRLGAYHLSANRKRGVGHYIAHMGGDDGCRQAVGYTSAMLKPYPKKDEDKPWFQMCERWNAAAMVAA
jgi:hypothetical protein